MTRIIALALALTAGPGLAIASNEAAGTVLDEATSNSITETLTAQGYDVQEIEPEEDGFEVYALKDGALWEVELTAELTIVEAELEDDDDADHDDDD